MFRGARLTTVFPQNVSVSKDQMNMVIRHSLVVVERCGSLDTVLRSELFGKLFQLVSGSTA